MKYHQNITIDGKDMPAEYSNRKHSNFFNEGKWHNFIEPLLPADVEDRTFIEVGSNVGLYLRMAKKYGFRNVIGVEADPAACAMAEQYRANGEFYYIIRNETVGQDFSWDNMPAADVVLLSNMHYYIHMEHFMPFLDDLFHKTIYCIVVSRSMRDKKHGYPRPDIESICHMFRDWSVERVITTTSDMLDGDPHPRKVHSLLFRSQLQRQPISNHTSDDGYPKHQELIDIVKGKDIPLEDTLNWKYWVQRKQIDKGERGRWSDDEIKQYIQYRLDFTRDMMDNGMKVPILVDRNGKGIDGGNRAAVLKLLGYNSIIVRIV